MALGEVPHGYDQGRSLESRERPLSGKVALITGSSRDIGAAIAVYLAEEGVSILGNYLKNPKPAERTRMVIEQMDGFVEFIQADITVSQDRERIANTLDGSCGGKLDILVLNTSGNKDTARNVCVEGNNALVDMFLPKMREGGVIVLLQSVPGHFYDKLRELDKVPDFYEPIAKAKYEGEQLLRLRIPEFQDKGVSFIIVCPPVVEDTFNVRVGFRRMDKNSSFLKKHAEISDMLGLPRVVTTEDVGKKVVDIVIKCKDVPMGYVELFRP